MIKVDVKVFLLFISFFCLQAKVTTEILVKDNIEYYHDEIHKELGVYNWTYCPGEESKISNKNGIKVGGFSSNSNKGVGTSKFKSSSELGDYNGTNLEWNNFFDSKNYTFNINIKKKKAKKYSKEHNRICVKKRWEIKPVGNKTQVNVKLKLKIPKGVWVVRFHEKLEVKTGPGEIKVYGVAKIKDQRDKLMKKVWIQGLDNEGRPIFLEEKSYYYSVENKISENYHYFFVVPGETLTLVYSFLDSNSQDKQIGRGLEVMFVGYHHCVIEENNINEVFSTSNVINAIQEIGRIVNSSSRRAQVDKQTFHSNINFLACFGDENVVKSFMQKNGYIKGMEKYTEIIANTRTKDIDFDSSMASSSSVIANLKVPRMALFNHLYQYAVDLKQMCLPSTYKDGKTRFEYSLDKLNLISDFLFIDDKESFNDYFFESLVAYHKELNDFISAIQPNKTSFLNEDRLKKLNNLLSLTSNFRVGLFTQAELLYNGLEFPYISTDRQRAADLLGEISKTFIQFEKLNRKILSYLEQKNKSEEKISSDILKQIKKSWTDARVKGLLPLKNKMDELRVILSSINLDEDERSDFFFQTAEIFIEYLIKITKNLTRNDVSNYFMVKEVNKYLNPVSYSELNDIKGCLYESK